MKMHQIYVALFPTLVLPSYLFVLCVMQSKLIKLGLKLERYLLLSNAAQLHKCRDFRTAQKSHYC